MSKRAWVFVFALGLIASGLSGQTQEQTQGERGEANNSDKPALPFVVPVDVVESKAEAEVRQHGEQEARQREIDDLIAQRGMNAATQSMQRATEDMTRYSYVQTWLVGIGTVLLIVTLFLTRQANRAANKSVDVTNVMFQRQLRAYISIPGEGSNIRTTEQGVAVKIVFKNVGPTPASNIVFNGVIFVKRGLDVLAFAQVIEEHGGMAPGGTASMTSQIEDVPQARRAHWGTCFVHFQGRFFYMNGFNGLGVTGVSMWVEMKNGHVSQEGNYSASGNELS